MMFAEALNQIVRLRIGPGIHEMPVRLFDIPQAHIVHHRDQVQVYGGNGKEVPAHRQGGLRDTRAERVLPLQVQEVRLDVQSEGPQALGQERQHLLHVGHILGQRQVK